MKLLYSEASFQGFGPDSLHSPIPADGLQVQADSIPRLRKGIKALAPSRPGVYGMVDKHGEVIYIGKAKNLRKRLLGYFRCNAEQHKTRRILRRTATIAWEHVPTEFGALLRELDLIRRWRPRHNVMGQPTGRKRMFVCIGRPPAAYVFLSAEPTRSCLAFFGPVLAGPRTNQAVRHLNDYYRLRDCNQQQRMIFADQGQLFPTALTAGCLRYEIGTCLGPCAAACTKEEYGTHVRRVRNFLQRGQSDYAETLANQMKQASATLDFERAAQIRDRVRSLDGLRVELDRLDRAQQELTFVYPAQGANDEEVWYLIRRGKVLGARIRPSDARERRALAEEITGVYSKAKTSRLDQPSPSDLDHIWLVASWFRRYTVERARVYTPQEARKLLS